MRDELPAERLLRQLRGNEHAPAASSYSGVTWNVARGRWNVRISRMGNFMCRECRSEEEAARIYDVAVKLIYSGIPQSEWPNRCPARDKPNFDGNPPVGICTAQIKQWLIDAGLLVLN